jgi:gas vesicle protein GvpG
VIVLDSLLFGGIGFVLDKLAAAVDAEMDEEGLLREDLLAAQMRLELGEIDDDEFAAIESDVVARLREIRDAREREVGGTGALGAGTYGVEVTFADDELVVAAPEPVEEPVKISTRAVRPARSRTRKAADGPRRRVARKR